ncbi:MAG: division/cell wall cluster transcriptional repressor MraZ [Myxococcaceae bacterium]|nr:division/cell wall cluster transcriptional repressor MraZ [Myxococcaceae bacterium]MBH2006039.1 division/cell wall cluster transcriptional repressor MraZ [Myxococcaceae bacterium]
MFRGLNENLLDDKGRVAFPLEFRQVLKADQLVLTLSLYEPCLVALTLQDFELQADRLKSLPSSDPAITEFKRLVIASSFVASIDKAGRVAIPKELRSYAGLEREIYWAGMLDRIEVWSKERWNEKNRIRLSNQEGLERLRLTLEKFGL